MHQRTYYRLYPSEELWDRVKKRVYQELVEKNYISLVGVSEEDRVLNPNEVFHIAKLLQRLLSRIYSQLLKGDSKVIKGMFRKEYESLAIDCFAIFSYLLAQNLNEKTRVVEF